MKAARSAGPALKAPFPEVCADGEPRPDGGEEHQIAFLEPSAFNGVAGGQRDGGGGGVPVAVNVDNHLVLAQAQAMGYSTDDPEVGLVGDQQLDVLGGEAMTIQQLAADFA